MRVIEIQDPDGNMLLRSVGDQFEYDETTVEMIGQAIALEADAATGPLELIVSITVA